MDGHAYNISVFEEAFKEAKDFLSNAGTGRDPISEHVRAIGMQRVSYLKAASEDQNILQEDRDYAAALLEQLNGYY